MKRSLFRPCIDLHNGQVKQIVGGTLRDDGNGPRTNFVSEHAPEWYAEMYRNDELTGGHVIQLGPGNHDAARAALAAWPGGLQIGGGIRDDNVEEWLLAGASKVIITSWLFDNQHQFRMERLQEISQRIGPDRLVVDLSCRGGGGQWVVAMNRWLDRTDLKVTAASLEKLAPYCSEFLIHAADVEGLCRGMDETLVTALAEWSPLPCSYAGGARSFDDLLRVQDLSDGRIDLTIGSALDIFGGTGANYRDCVAWNQQ